VQHSLFPAEEWRPVVGYEARYQVSSLGRVWSLKNKKPLAPAPNSKGYLCVVLYDGSSPKRPRSFCVHDLVTAAFIGPKPQGYQVDHGRDGKQCNSVDNLEYVTSQENIRRSVADGRIVTYRGVENANAKLTARDVRVIRRVWPHRKRGTVAKLARRFKVDPMTIYTVGTRQRYKEIT